MRALKLGLTVLLLGTTNIALANDVCEMVGNVDAKTDGTELAKPKPGDAKAAKDWAEKSRQVREQEKQAAYKSFVAAAKAKGATHYRPQNAMINQSGDKLIGIMTATVFRCPAGFAGAVAKVGAGLRKMDVQVKPLDAPYDEKSALAKH